MDNKNNKNFGTYSLWFAEKYLDAHDLWKWQEKYLPLNMRVEMLVNAGCGLPEVEKLQRIWDIHRCANPRRANREIIDTAIELPEYVVNKLS